jgi:hypothetical protein
MMADAYTINIKLAGLGRGMNRLWDGLKQLEELKAMRVWVTERKTQCWGPHDPDSFNKTLDFVWGKIADVAKHRLKNGLPLHIIERIAVNKNGKAVLLRDVLRKPGHSTPAKENIATHDSTVL